MDFSHYEGSLFICPTPIGNMQDITFRVLTCLKEVDCIACEDTRRTQKLLNYFEIKKQLTSYHKFNQEKKGRIILDRLKKGENIALVADAGTPGISDPGQYLVKHAIDKDIPIVPLPGPSAAVTALTASGLNTDSFLFLGFIPEKGSKRKHTLNSIAVSEDTVVLYENARRLTKTLAELMPVLEQRQIVIAREVTKLHEEFIRGKCEDIIQTLEQRDEIKGETTVIIEGGSKDKAGAKVTDTNLHDHLSQLIAAGFSKKDAIKLVSELSGIAKNKVYQEALKLDTQKGES